MSWKELFQPEYMSYSAQEFARENDILYIPSKFCELRVPDREASSNSLILAENRYILLYPPNDGKRTCPFDFYRKAKHNRYVKVIDNQRAFCEITNLPEILLQIASLYEHHIDNPIFLDPMSFAVMLIDNIDKRYTGRGKLAITDDTLCNNNVKPENQNDARRYFYNEFLDHFIGWNFGKAVSECDQLEYILYCINRQLVLKGLRKNAGPGFSVWCSKDVWHVEYSVTGYPEVISF